MKALQVLKFYDEVLMLAATRRKLMRFITTFALLALSYAASAREAESLPMHDEFQATRGISVGRGYTIAGLFGGNDPNISRRLASGAIGCPVNEIGISNEDSARGIHTFTAHCKGREYFCTYKYPAPISCSQTVGTTDAEVEEHRLELAEGMEAWKLQVIERLHQVWEKPSEYDGSQKIIMTVKVDERGRLLNLQWVSRSGDRGLDKSILKAFKKINPYPVPTDPGVAFNGVEFSFP